MPARKTAELPLHSGSTPAWLFQRMVDLAGAIGTLIVRDSGPEELLRRLSDPFWFQAFGCVLGFDWHSSGVTTTVCGALKEAARRVSGDLGIVVCGGKGATSRKTPDDIRRACDKTSDSAEELIQASKLAAKVDNAAVQDGYQLYHHCFFFVPRKHVWCVVQQGMNEAARYARRYHWLSEQMPSFVSEPHAAVACDSRNPTLNLVAGEGEKHRQAVTNLSREHPDRILREIRPLLQEPELPLFAGLDSSPPLAASRSPQQFSEQDAACEGQLSIEREAASEKARYILPARHSLGLSDLEPTSLKKVLIKTYERQASTFEELVGEPGIGPHALRSLSLIAEVIYQAGACRRDPAAYSFAHGGKDGHPYHVNRQLYDANIDRLRQAISRAKVGQADKVESLRALGKFCSGLG
jgi:uncharacterized protein